MHHTLKSLATDVCEVGVQTLYSAFADVATGVKSPLLGPQYCFMKDYKTVSQFCLYRCCSCWRGKYLLQFPVVTKWRS